MMDKNDFNNWCREAGGRPGTDRGWASCDFDDGSQVRAKIDDGLGGGIEEVGIEDRGALNMTVVEMTPDREENVIDDNSVFLAGDVNESMWDGLSFTESRPDGSSRNVQLEP